MKKGAIFTEEHRRKLSEAHKGLKHSEVTRAKISKAHKGKPFSGIKCDWTGRRHTESTKQKIKEKLAIAKANGWKPDTSGLNRSGFNQKHTIESRIKMSRSQTGLKRPNISERNKRWVGELAPNWRGGITKPNKLEREKFRRQVQKLVFGRDNYTCVLCKSSGYLQVDHIKSWKGYPELRFDLSNCRTLCVDCHYLVTFGKPRPTEVKTWGLNFAQLRLGG